MGKIIVSELLKMLVEGKSGVEMAAYFQVSPAAVCKAIAKHKPVVLPESFDKLAEGKKRYVIARQTMSKTDAAQQAYSCERTSARTLGAKLDRDPDVSVALADLLHQSGAGRRVRMQRLSDVIFSPNLSEASRGIELAAKICGDMGPEIEVNVSIEQIRSLLQLIPDPLPQTIDVTPQRD